MTFKEIKRLVYSSLQSSLTTFSMPTYTMKRKKQTEARLMERNTNTVCANETETIWR